MPNYTREYYHLSSEELMSEFASSYNEDLEEVPINELRAEAKIKGILSKGLSRYELLDLLYDNFIDEEYTNYGTINERIQYDLEYLEENYINRNSEERYYLNLSEVKPIIVLELDAIERYGYEADELVDYMLELLNNLSKNY